MQDTTKTPNRTGNWRPYITIKHEVIMSKKIYNIAVDEELYRIITEYKQKFEVKHGMNWTYAQALRSMIKERE